MKSEEEYKKLTLAELQNEKCFCEGEFVCNRCWAFHDVAVIEKGIRKLVADEI